MRLLVLTTSFPNQLYPHSGIFVRRLLDCLPEDIQITVLTPGLAQSNMNFACDQRTRVIAFRYAFRRWQTLAQGEGGIPSALKHRPWQWMLVPFFCMAMFVQTIRLARRVDLIHAHWSACGMVAGLSGGLIDRPVVVTLRGTDVAASEKSLLFRLAIYLCGLFCDQVVAVADAMAALTTKWLHDSKAPVRVIPNGVGPGFCGSRKINDAQGFTIAVIGHLVPIKNVGAVVNAFTIFGQHAPSARLLVVGDGEQRPALEALVQRLGLARRVTFTGSIPPDAVPEILSRCNTLVLASRSEGRPNVVLEAMAAGVPVVASDIDGVREMIVHGERGLLFPVDDTRKLAAHLRLLMEAPALARRLAVNARQWVDAQGLTWENAGRRYAELYHEVLRRRHRQSN